MQLLVQVFCLCFVKCGAVFVKMSSKEIPKMSIPHVFVFICCTISSRRIFMRPGSHYLCETFFDPGSKAVFRTTITSAVQSSAVWKPLWGAECYEQQTPNHRNSILEIDWKNIKWWWKTDDLELKRLFFTFTLTVLRKSPFWMFNGTDMANMQIRININPWFRKWSKITQV